MASLPERPARFSSRCRANPCSIAAALIAVYIVLGVLYESYIHPITIISTLPSAGVGAVLALMVWHTEFSIIALIGVILLIGIVKKNAIMMIDFAIHAERTQGIAPREAIYQACLLRFRPIMMTTLAALLGAVPLAFSYGNGAELRRPLGISIVGGLHRESGADAVHHAGALRLPRSMQTWIEGALAAALDGRRRQDGGLMSAAWQKTRRRFRVLAAALLLSSCAVGPNYHRPAAPVPAAFKELPEGRAGLEARFAAGRRQPRSLVVHLRRCRIGSPSNSKWTSPIRT